MAAKRETVDLSQYPNLVVIYLGMRRTRAGVPGTAVSGSAVAEEELYPR